MYLSMIFILRYLLACNRGMAELVFLLWLWLYDSVLHCLRHFLIFWKLTQTFADSKSCHTTNVFISLINLGISKRVCAKCCEKNCAVLAGMVLGKYLGSRGVERWTGRTGRKNRGIGGRKNGCDFFLGDFQSFTLVFVSLKATLRMFNWKKIWLCTMCAIDVLDTNIFVFNTHDTLDMLSHMYGSCLYVICIYVYKTLLLGVPYTQLIWNVRFCPALWSNHLM